ncbi:hypothetical protein ACPUD7_12950 [Brevibacterium sp. FAM 24630]
MKNSKKTGLSPEWRTSMLVLFRHAFIVLAAVPLIAGSIPAEAVPKSTDPLGPESAQSLDIRPRQIASEEFVTGKNSVRISVEGLYPDEEVRLDVDAAPREIDDFQQTKRVGQNGSVTFDVMGVSASDPNRYAGNYRAQVITIGGDRTERMTAAFTVIAVAPHTDRLKLDSVPR